MKSIFGSPEPGDSIAAQPEHQMSVVLGAESCEMPWDTYYLYIYNVYYIYLYIYIYIIYIYYVYIYIYPTIGIIHPKTQVILIWIMCIPRQGLLRQLVTRLSMCISSQGLAVHQLRCGYGHGLRNVTYPLVNIQKTMENHHFLWEIPL